jgi:hypothetical protein
VTSSGGEVVKLLQVNGVMYAGGRFTTVAPAGTTTGGVTRDNIVAFDPTTGAISTTFTPSFDGEVDALASDGSYLYVGGKFKTVNGVARRGVAKLTFSGDLVTGFHATTVRANVYDMRLVAGRLIVGGAFAKRLAALNTSTGADTGYINVGISGTVADNAGNTDVYRFSVNPDGTKLVAIGNFTTVGTATRYRAFMLDLGTSAATLNGWYYTELQKMCAASSLPSYLRDVDFSPDGSYFVIVATGYIPRSGDLFKTVCDAAARFDTNVLAPTAPKWINYTGGDTLHSVVVTGAAVYVGGHQRWLDNPYGNNSAGTGAVARDGIGAIDPTTGKALPWNPGRERGVGAKELYTTAAGLWMGHDTQRVSGELRVRLAFFPLP